MRRQSVDLANFRRRVLQDAFAEARADHWRRRAEAFEAARCSPGEFHGRATREALRSRYDRLSETAAACRAAAELALIQDDALTGDEWADLWAAS